MGCFAPDTIEGGTAVSGPAAPSGDPDLQTGTVSILLTDYEGSARLWSADSEAPAWAFIP